MNKVSGKKSDFKVLSEDTSRIVIAYGLKKVGTLYEWFEIYLYKSMKNLMGFSEIKQAIIDDINSRTKERIISRFVWNDINVWLSEESQRNYTETLRMAELQSEDILPANFKLGEDADGNPVYHEFETVEELKQFCVAFRAYINQCLNDGYREKDAIVWKDYGEPDKEEGKQ